LELHNERRLSPDPRNRLRAGLSRTPEFSKYDGLKILRLFLEMMQEKC